MNSSYFFSRKVPNDVVVQQGAEGKCIARGLGSATTAIYGWPDTEESQKIFNEWWSHAGSMGTLPFLLPGTQPYRLYFSKQLWVSFDTGRTIIYCYRGGKDIGGTLFYRRTNKYDRALFQYILNQTADKRNKLHQDKAKILGRKCAGGYFSYGEYEKYH